MVTQPRRLRALVVAAAIAILAPAIAAVPVAGASADTRPTGSTPSTVSSDALPTVQINGVAWTQLVVGNTVFVGGEFTQAQPAGAAAGVNTTARSNMLAYDVTTGALITSFAPTFNAAVKGIAASADGSTLYVVGSFTQVNGVNEYRTVALNASTGAVITKFKATTNSAATSVAVAGSTVYIGGAFSSVNSTTRSRAAAVDATTGAVLPWAPVAADGYVRAIVVSPDRSKVVLGGSFSSLNGNTRPGDGLGAVDATTGASVDWNVGKTIYDGGANASIYSLWSDGTNVYGTGYVYGGLQDGNLEGAFNASWTDGSINWIEDCHGDSYSVASLGDTVYTVSHDHYCGNVPGGFQQTDPDPTKARKQYALAYSKPVSGTLAHDTYGGSYADFGGQPAPQLLTWYPDLTAGTYTGQGQAAWSVSAGSGYLVLGGEFQTVNGKRQTGLVRFATTDKAPNTDGPRVSGANWPATTVSLSAGTARVTWPANYDRDNANLTYAVSRKLGGGAYTVVSTTTGASHDWWDRPQMGFVDSGLTPGSTYTYKVTATDPFGNTVTSGASTVTASAGSAATPYSNAVIADGASDYWRFGEATGSTVYDWAGYSDLTAGTGVTLGASGAISGDTNTAAAFSGNDDASGLAATSTPVAGPQTFSVEGWFNTTSTSGGKIVGFGDKNSGNSSSYDRHVYMDGSGHVIFGVYPGFTATVQSAASFNDGKWHQMVASLSSGGMQLFVDGKRVGARADVTSAQAYTGYWRVGGDNTWSGSNYFAGSIDDVAVYPTALSAATVKNHFALSGNGTVTPAPADAYGAAVFQDAPDLYWRLGDAAGSGTAADASGNGDSGNVQGGVGFGADGAVKGTSDSAATFDGDSGLVVASQAVTDPEVYTEELWFKTTTDRGGKLIGFGNATSGLSDNYDRHVWMLDSGQLEFGIWTGNATTVTSSGTYNDGAWHHVAATQGSDGLKLYVDGTLLGSNPVGQAQSYTGYWRVGGDQAWGGNSSAYFAGTIDDAAVYSSELTASDIASHYALGSGPRNQAPTAAFTATADHLDVAFDGTGSADSDGSIASYAWDFGDGKTATGASPKHSYDAAGVYQAALTVTDDDGAANTVTKQVTVTAPNAAPTASFTSSSTGLTAAFDAAASKDADGSVASYSWDFGDGSSAGVGVNPTHTYGKGGTYTVTLTVTDDGGSTGTTTAQVIVAAANATPKAVVATSTDGLKVSADGTGSSDSDGTIASYAWDFGDGATATTASPSHTYAASGTFTVTLTVSDDKGATDTATKQVTVAPAAASPTARFTASATDRTAKVDGSGSTDPDGTIASYAWNFGDGATATGATAQHAYATDGSYTITLTVTDSSGATDTTTHVVTVSGATTSTAARDAFGRTVTGGLGSADVGGAWTTSGGASRFSVASGAGQLSTAAGVQLSAYLNSVSAGDTDASATVSMPALPVGGSTYEGLVVRRSGSNEYSGRVIVSASGAVVVNILRGSTSLKSATVSGLTYTAGSALKLRVQAVGSSPTTLQARVWKAGATEPSTWQVSTTDATDGFQSAGSVGVRSYVSGGVSNGPAVGTFDDFSVSAPSAAPANSAPTASFTSSVSGLVASFDGTGSSDSDGKVASYAWSFGDGATATTSTPQHTYGAAGTYTVGLTVTDDGGATGTTTKQVTVSAAPATSALAQDAFGRTVVNGLGTADTGGAWSLAGSASRFSVGSGAAQLSTLAGAQLSGYLNGVTATDVDASATVSFAALPVGGSAYSGLLVRRTTSGEYTARVIVSASGAVTLNLLQGGTSLKSVAVPGLTYTPGAALKLRVQAIGSTPTTLQARVWKADATEPSTWQVSATDSTAALQSAGGVGIRSYISSGVTNGPVLAGFDDLAAVKP